MVHGAVHLLFRIIGAVMLLLLVGGGVLAWRLSQGPLPLDRLTPYLQEALAEQSGDFRILLGRTFLTWERVDHDLDLRVTDVRAVDAQGNVLAAVPETAITLSPRALLKGRIRLSSLEMIAPHIQLLRQTDGSVRFGLLYPGSQADDLLQQGNGGDAVLRALMSALAGSDGDGPTSHLTAVRIVDADFTITDHRLNAVWRVPDALVELFRNDGGAVGLAASLEVAMPEGTTHVDVVGEYEPGRHVADLGATFTGLRPAALATFAEGLAPLAGLDLPLSGTATLTVQLSPRPEIRHAGLVFDGGRGTVRLPAPVDTAYGVRRVRFRGSVATDRQELLVDHLEMELDRPHPGSSPVVHGQGVVRRQDARWQAELRLGLADLPVDALADLWPAHMAGKPRRWIVEHLSDGVVRQGEWTVGLEGPRLDSLAVTAFSGAARAEGVTVDYLPPMPKVHGAVADVTFGLDAVNIAVAEGAADDVTIQKGIVALLGLRSGDHRAVINLDLGGDLGAALALVDHAPLGYAARLGLSPRGAEGRVTAQLRLAFPLIAGLQVESLRVEAKAVLEDVVLPGAVFGHTLSDGDLSLRVDNGGLDARGQARIAGVPAGFAWRENFAGKPFRSRYVVKASLVDDRRAALGLDFAPFAAPFLSGPVSADLEFTVFDEKLSTLGAQLDLTEAVLALPFVDWMKPAGVPGQANLAVRLEGNRVHEVSRFMVRAGDTFAAEGSVHLHRDGRLDRVAFNHLELGETRLKGTLARRVDGGWDLDVRGPSLDATPLLTEDRRGPKLDLVRPAWAAERDAGTAPPFVLHGAFDVVWVADAGTLENVAVHLVRTGGLWRSARLEGMVEGRTPFLFVLGAEGHEGNRSFAARTEDAGGLLRVFNLIETMRGGSLEAQGTVDAAGRAQGQVRIEDYRVVDAPVLARLLSVAALTGILDALTGEGIAFRTLEAPFTYHEDVVTITDFRAYGPSLGLTADGTVNLETDEMTVTGTLVPAYALNSLLGRLPVVGGLLSGFEEGGGVFAATYAMNGPVNDPRIRVNPLSALAPGILRRFFDLMGPADGPGVQSAEPPGAAPSQ